MVAFDITMKHTEESLEALAHMHFEPDCAILNASLKYNGDI